MYPVYSHSSRSFITFLKPATLLSVMINSGRGRTPNLYNIYCHYFNFPDYYTKFYTEQEYIDIDLIL